MTEIKRQSTTSADRRWSDIAARSLVDVTERQASLLLEAAHLLMTLGHGDKADQIFEGLSLLLPTFELPWLGRGLVAQAQSRHEESLQFFRKAQRIGPRSGLVRLHVAEVLLALGKRDEAVREYRSALRLEPVGPIAEIATHRLNLIRDD